MKDFNELLQELKDAGLQLAKDEFKDYYEKSKQAIEEFFESSKDKLEQWSIALATGNINGNEFKMLLQSEKDLFTLELLKQAGLKQIRINKFKDQLIDLIVDKLE